MDNLRLAPKRIYAVFKGNQILKMTHDEREAIEFRNVQEDSNSLVIMFKNLEGPNPTPPGEWIYWRTFSN